MPYIPNYTPHLRAIRKIIGKNIHKIRMERGLTLRDFARMTDMNIYYLDHFERGKNKVHLEALIRISARFQVRMEEFFREEDVGG